MLKKVTKVIMLIFLFTPIFIFADSENDLNLYLFYGKECPHCEALLNYLEPYIKDKENVKLYKYEVWHNEENLKKLEEVHKIMTDSNSGVPYLVIGNTGISGFSEKLTPDKIASSIEYYSHVKFVDRVGIYLGVVDENTDTSEDNKNDLDSSMNIPIFGKKNVKEFPILLSAVVIGLVDGLNPCSIWILIFLISILLSMKNKKRKWVLGITFLLSSGLVYFLFLISWINLEKLLNDIIYIRTAIATFAMIFGFSSILKFVNKKDDRCEDANSKNRKSIILSIKKIIKEKSFTVALLGIIVLAASINVVELLCSLRLPVMFSEILTINNVNLNPKIFYSIVYILFFILDDIIIFIIAMKIIENKVISNKYGKYFQLIGGIIMVIISALMIFKPEWLMLNF
jgi:glutaredoxin